MTIRLAAQPDLPTVLRVTEAAYAPWVPVLDGKPMPMTEDYEMRIAQGEVWLQEFDGQTPGLIVIEEHPDHIYIFSVAVDPEFHGKGHGGELLDFAEERAHLAGLSELRLCTNARMERNVAIYARRGYRETGRRDHPHRPGWVLVDMAKAVQ